MTAHSNISPDLSGLQILEIDCGAAGAFASALLSDYGADTIICEGPPEGSALRRLAPDAVRHIWWKILARNKRSLAIDIRNAAAKGVLERLHARAGLVIDADPSAPAASDNDNMALHLFPTGADDPQGWGWSIAPELAGAASGMMALTGWAGGPPVQPEFPLADYTTGIMGAASALIEMRASHLAKRNPVPLSFATHETMLRMNEWQLVIASAMSKPEVRVGNRLPMNTNVGSIFETRDGKLLTVSAATQTVIMRLIAMVGGEAAARDPRFRTLADRKENMDALEAIIADWMRQHDAVDAMEQVQAHDVVAGPIFDAEDLMASPQLAARGAIRRLADNGGTLAMPAVLPTIQGANGVLRWVWREIGADTDDILAELGYHVGEIAEFRRLGAIWK